MTDVDRGRGIARWIKPVAAVAAIGALTVLILYMAGTIGGHEVAPGRVPLPPAAPPPDAARVRVERRAVEDFLEWPGTVRSRTVAAVAPKLLARVVEVRLAAGAAVKAGDPIAILDDRDVRARAGQARGAVAAAESDALQAEADRARARSLFEKKAATDADLERSESRARMAAAHLEQARHALAEADALLADTAVRAPFDGAILERLAEPGDMAAPGKPIAIVHDPRRLRLEAVVPEHCAVQASVGMEVVAALDALGREVVATIDEIAPAADPQTRTFLLRAALAEDPALRAGTFGRFRQPCGKREALLVPAAAVARAGQLESVRVLDGGEARWRNIRTGKVFGDHIEVLAGLDGGEVVLVEARP